MPKKETLPDDSPVLTYQADPESFRTIVLKIHKKLDTADTPYVGIHPRSEGENDALLMSQDFPDEPFITVFQNGIPCTMSVNDLIRDTVISIMAATKED